MRKNLIKELLSFAAQLAESDDLQCYWLVSDYEDCNSLRVYSSSRDCFCSVELVSIGYYWRYFTCENSIMVDSPDLREELVQQALAASAANPRKESMEYWNRTNTLNWARVAPAGLQLNTDGLIVLDPVSP